LSYRYPFGGTPWRNYFSQNRPILPFESVTELALEGFAPLATFGGNDGHPTDLYDSLEQELPGKNAEALYFALFGTPDMEIDAGSTGGQISNGGHEHQTPENEIEWLPVWQSSFPTGLAQALHNANAFGTYANSQTYKELGWAVIPLGEWNINGLLGQTYFYFRGRGYSPAFGSANITDMDIKITLFKPPGAGSKEVTSQIGNPFILKIPYNASSESWVTAPPVDLTNTVFVTNQGWAFMYAKFEIRASASPGDVTLFELQVGRIPV
jgi:hypothetical protein